MIQVDFKSRVPIYRQIVDGFRRRIRAGEALPDERVPSIRDLARTLGINPNTVQKAYLKLEEGGYFYAAQGQGSFIAKPPEARAREETETLYAELKRIKEELLMLGESADDVLRFLGKGEKNG